MKRGYLGLMLAAMLVSGCVTQPKASFYLVPDPEGHIGEVTVSNQAGSVTLSKANEAVAVLAHDKAPRPAREADPLEIQAKFREALTLMPPPPKEFTIYFDIGSNSLDEASKEGVARALAEWRERDSRDISVNGHTDRLGDSRFNMQLSLERAQIVIKLLLEQGVREEHISMEYYGESKPIVPTADDVSEPKNRRVEVVVR